MSYRAQLYPWYIVRQLPKMQNAVVARCRSRNEAEEHLRVLRRIVRDGEFAIAFDRPQPVDSPSTAAGAELLSATDAQYSDR